MGGNPIYGIDLLGLCEEKKCRGNARILEGNHNHVGKTGGFGTTINSSSMAIIPDQWGGKSNVKNHLNDVSATVGGKTIANNIGDVVGPKSARTKLPERYPNTVIIELPGGADQGVQPVEIRVPGDMNCPVGLTEVKK